MGAPRPSWLAIASSMGHRLFFNDIKRLFANMYGLSAAAKKAPSVKTFKVAI